MRLLTGLAGTIALGATAAAAHTTGPTPASLAAAARATFTLAAIMVPVAVDLVAAELHLLRLFGLGLALVLAADVVARLAARR